MQNDVEIEISGQMFLLQRIPLIIRKKSLTGTIAHKWLFLLEKNKVLMILKLALFTMCFHSVIKYKKSSIYWHRLISKIYHYILHIFLFSLPFKQSRTRTSRFDKFSPQNYVYFCNSDNKNNVQFVVFHPAFFSTKIILTGIRNHK